MKGISLTCENDQISFIKQKEIIAIFIQNNLNDLKDVAYLLKKKDISKFNVSLHKI